MTLKNDQLEILLGVIQTVIDTSLSASEKKIWSKTWEINRARRGRQYETRFERLDCTRL